MTSVALLSLTLLTAGGAFGQAESEVARFVTALRADDVFAQKRGESDLRRRGAEALPALLDAYREATGPIALQLHSLLADLLDSFLVEYENNALLFAHEQSELDRLQAFITETNVESAISEAQERIKNLSASLSSREPRVAEQQGFLERLLPVALPDILRRQEYVQPTIATRYDAVFEAALEGLAPDTRLALPPEGPDSARARHQRAALWIWAIETGAGEAAGAAPVLNEHFERTYKELQSPDHRVRERAEDAFFIGGLPAIEFLETTLAAEPADPADPAASLLELLRWRIHPRVKERTSMDFRHYASMGFRERRRHIIRYARTADQAAVPTLRLIVYDDSREKSIRVKLTAAEALAGLGDVTAIQDLSRRQVPELLKIPEISREFFLLKGIQFHEEKAYDLAIQEFEKILAESPFHFEANYRIAFSYLLKEDYAKSIHYFLIALRVQPGDSLTLYNLACAYSLNGQVNKALDALEGSVENGFDDPTHISRDPDLDPLRENPRFKALLLSLQDAPEE